MTKEITADEIAEDKGVSCRNKRLEKLQEI